MYSLARCKPVFKSYLTGRTQQVDCGGILSNSALPMTRGVPHSSHPGPLLFLVCVNNFSNCLKYSDSLMYADDTTVILENENPQLLYTRTHDELCRIDQWMHANKLSINVSKTTIFYLAIQDIKLEQLCPK